jgi:protoporphyrinogen oxidase
MSARAGEPAAERWGIVGGGMLGLTLALRLSQQGKQVTLLEGADHVGGLASAWSLGDVVWDRHYHVTLLSDTHLRGVLRELDLEREMEWVETKTGFYADGRLASVSNALEFLTLPSLSPIGKLRLGATILYGSRVRHWERLERVPVDQWLTRWSGRSTFERFWLPLLRAKLGESHRQASAAFIWATIRRLYAARRTGLKKEMFGYVPGGYARILARFADVLSGRGVTIRLGARVEQVERVEAGGDGGPGVRVGFAEGAPATFDQVVVTAAAPIAARLCAGLSADERRRLDAIRYQGIVCASLLLRRSLADYYLTYITDDTPFTAVVEMSAFVDKRHLGGHALVYLPKYVAPDDPLFDGDDRDLEASFLDALDRMYPQFRRDDVLCFQVSRVRQVFTVPTIGYSRLLPPMSTSVPGLHVVNSAHIVNGTLNVDETVELAERAARDIGGAAPTRVGMARAEAGAVYDSAERWCR